MQNIVLIAFLLGMVLHHAVFIRGEWHLQAPSVLVAHCIALCLLFAFGCLPTGRGVLRFTSVEIVIFSTVYMASLLMSIAVYRLFFHRLKVFPGPRLAALSKLWHVWKCRDSRGHLVAEEWHQQYGDSRSDWYDLLYPRISSIFTRDKAVHDARKKIWESALNPKLLAQYCNRLTSLLKTFVDCVEASGPGPIEINELVYCFAFDSMGEFGFGQDFGLMKKGRLVDGAFYIRSALTLLGPFSPAIWIPRLGFAFIPGFWAVKHWFQMLAYADGLINAKLNAKLDGVDCTDFRALSNLPHLTGTINESMRLLPSILSFSSKIVRLTGLNVNGVFIPGGTKISAPCYSLGRLSTAFVEPHSFIPERWYSKSELVLDKRAFAPFGSGRTSCAGKHLAMAQLRLFAAGLLSRYNITFAPGERNGEAVERDMRDQLTASPGRLNIVFEKRG
ncbi:benzoate 4-monooxygenase cytochrome P450 [Xylariaceae sp. FL0255]|nr:benzoate 4-monooxygenase cytochrome P450 [Xylariaceae sp. FL0255]